MQQASLATQSSLSRVDTPVGITLMFFGQSLGGAIFNAIAQAVFDECLRIGLTAVTGLDLAKIMTIGAIDVRHVRANSLCQVLEVYSNALQGPFFVMLVACSLLIIPTGFVEWKRLPPKPKPGQAMQTESSSSSSTSATSTAYSQPILNSGHKKYHK